MHNQDPIYPLIERMFDLENEPQDWDGKSEFALDMGDYGTVYVSSREHLERLQRDTRIAIRELVNLHNARMKMNEDV